MPRRNVDEQRGQPAVTSEVARDEVAWHRAAAEGIRARLGSSGPPCDETLRKWCVEHAARAHREVEHRLRIITTANRQAKRVAGYALTLEHARRSLEGLCRTPDPVFLDIDAIPLIPFHEALALARDVFDRELAREQQRRDGERAA